MNNSFPRMLTLLRKERGLSQKAAAQELGVSQALLSHYEKGIRECGLAFLVRAADFYQVSCDYLLGTTPHRSGGTLKAEDLPDPPASLPADSESQSLKTDLHKKLLIHSIQVLFGLLENWESEPLTNEAAAFLEAAVYKVFRPLYTANSKNPKGVFAFPEPSADGFSTAAMSVAAANLRGLLSGENPGSKKTTGKNAAPPLSPEILSLEYPALSEALFLLIREVETRMAQCHTEL